MKELSYNKNGYVLSKGPAGHQYLYHIDGRSWRVAKTLKQLAPGMEAFYPLQKEKKAINLHLPTICQFTDLKVLILNKCEIDYLPAEIGQMTQLTALHLEKNQITMLPAEIGQLRQLTELNLGRNLLLNLSDLDCENHRSLQKLNIKGNKFWLLPQNIHCLTNLEELNLSNCNLNHIPLEVKSLPLKYFRIDLSHNPIHEEEIEALYWERPLWHIIN